MSTKSAIAVMMLMISLTPILTPTHVHHIYEATQNDSLLFYLYFIYYYLRIWNALHATRISNQLVKFYWFFVNFWNVPQIMLCAVYCLAFYSSSMMIKTVFINILCMYVGWSDKIREINNNWMCSPMVSYT